MILNYLGMENPQKNTEQLREKCLKLLILD